MTDLPAKVDLKNVLSTAARVDNIAAYMVRIGFHAAANLFKVLRCQFRLVVMHIVASDCISHHMPLWLARSSDAGATTFGIIALVGM